MASAILQPSRVFQVEHPWRLGRQVLRAGPASGPLFPSPSSSLLTALGLQLSYWFRSPVLYDTAPQTEASEPLESPLRVEPASHLLHYLIFIGQSFMLSIGERKAYRRRH